MKLVDANVLLYAVNAEAPEQRVSRGWLDRTLNAGEPVAFTWLVLVAFLRLSTLRGAFSQPIAVDQATGVVRRWLAQPASVVLEPTPRHADVLAGLVAGVGTGGNLVNDAHLAALALEHDATIVSFDRDFGRFEGVRWELPA